jgi:hypothetical protein
MESGHCSFRLNAFKFCSFGYLLIFFPSSEKRCFWRVYKEDTVRDFADAELTFP